MLALLLASSGAWADWVKLGETDEATFYIDPATIRKEGNLRRVWEMQDLKQKGRNGQLSFRARTEYDCNQDRIRILSLSTHSELMGSGKTLSRGSHPLEWEDIPPGTYFEAILKIVCAK
jgi:hypothetical protein